MQEVSVDPGLVARVRAGRQKLGRIDRSEVDEDIAIAGAGAFAK